MILHFAVGVNTAFLQYYSHQFLCFMYNTVEVNVMFRRIRDLREDHDLTQKEMANILNYSQQVYSNYELGQRDIPTDILIKLSNYYDISIDYILEISNDPEILK